MCWHLLCFGELRGSRGGSLLGSCTALQRDSLTVLAVSGTLLVLQGGEVHGASAAGAGAVHGLPPHTLAGTG